MSRIRRDTILRMLDLAGDAHDVESGTNLRVHMLTAAGVASRRRLPPQVVCAALLHDIGHVLFDDSLDSPVASIDEEHAWLGGSWLRLHGMPQSVTALVEAHVCAKRYLARHGARYLARLDLGSEQSLEVQGGAMDDAEAEEFRARPDFEWAMAVRSCDDAAKHTQPIDLCSLNVQSIFDMVERTWIA